MENLENSAEVSAFHIFTVKLSELMQEASANGLAVVAVMVYDDRLAASEQSRVFANGVGPVFAAGMFEFGKNSAGEIFRTGSEGLINPNE